LKNNKLNYKGKRTQLQTLPHMELISGVGAEVDKKALAVLKIASDYWTPAYKDGHKVSSWSVVRIGR
jgi:hypothetical protein